MSRIVVIGDIMVDETVHCASVGISQERPVPVVKHNSTVRNLGGAANVAANVASLGHACTLIGALGCNRYEGLDTNGEFVVSQSKAYGINLCPIHSYDIMTTTKHRVVADGHLVCRVDFERFVRLQEDDICGIVDALASKPDTECIIISDYAKGVCNRSLLFSVIGYARKFHIPVIVDPKGRDFTRYRGCSIITPNLKEAEVGLNCRIDDANLYTAMQDISCAINNVIINDVSATVFDGSVLLKRSELGMDLLCGEKIWQHYPALTQYPVDVSGAGDTVVAALAVGLLEGLSLAQSVGLASIAAATVVSKPGISIVTKDEIHLVKEQIAP